VIPDSAVPGRPRATADASWSAPSS
jgi:hypothetical protein